MFLEQATLSPHSKIMQAVTGFDHCITVAKHCVAITLTFIQKMYMPPF